MSMRTLAFAGLGTWALAYWLDFPRFRGRLVGQVALVSGGSRGLGLLLAKRLQELGARVHICARNEEELRRAGEGLQIHVCDIADEASVQRMVDGIFQDEGKIDILVNNAGIMQVAPAELLKPSDFRKILDVNFMGTVHLSQAVIPQMKRRHQGKIINITSIGGLVSVPHLLSYSSSKFAAVGYSLGLRAEMSQYGISVSTIVPGLMRTGSYVHVGVKGQRRKEITWFSLGASLPLLSMDAERAARRIINKGLRGAVIAPIGMPAKLGRLVAGLAPGFTVRIFSLVNRFLPSPGSDLNQSFEEGRRFRNNNAA